MKNVTDPFLPLFLWIEPSVKWGFFNLVLDLDKKFKQYSKTKFKQKFFVIQFLKFEYSSNCKRMILPLRVTTAFLYLAPRWIDWLNYMNILCSNSNQYKNDSSCLLKSKLKYVRVWILEADFSFIQKKLSLRDRWLRLVQLESVVR